MAKANKGKPGGGGSGEIIGTDGPDLLSGTLGADILRAGAGDDTLFGLDGDDALYGEAGNDLISPGLGNDLIDGGEGTDFATYDVIFDSWTLTEITRGKNKGALELTYQAGGVSYTDTLVNMEYVFLGDGSVLDLAGGGGGGGTPQTGLITFEADQTTTVPESTLFGIVVQYGYHIVGEAQDFVVLQFSAPQGDASAGVQETAGALLDHDGDDDFEFRVFSDADGTTHEMNLSKGGASFDVASLKLTGLDAGETVELAVADAGGAILETRTYTAGADIADGMLAVGASDIGQLVLVAGAGDAFYVDDILIA
ncbi:hypothetical protein HMH01_09580 [Halovulum dunhuangense]|uniref:Hemolysin type calcium-binding protein n=1 Tax=Halovulum dunhuangense TaxID=1505036 RepID=A0A849L315_9RHOB|nr:hypothetical protein [Halovulum dunhuangense]NNU80685.1 hypothetical protein [Halovulum dunhuangense]